MSHRLLISLLLILAFSAGLAGCSDEANGPGEVKKIDDPISETELRSFLSIIDSLPEKRMPPMQQVLLPPPNWTATRSLPVGELVQGERKLLEEHASVEYLAKHVSVSKTLERSLRREKMSPQQFVGLALALGMAVSRNELPDSEDLDKILSRGNLVLSVLEKDKRVFNTLSEESIYYVLEEAAWIPLVDRLRRLKKVPDENRDLVRRHVEELKRVLPDEFQRSPLQGLSKVLEEESLPFTDPGGVNPDDHIAWSHDAALLGTDPASEPKPSSETPALKTLPVSAQPDHE